MSNNSEYMMVDSITETTTLSHNYEPFYLSAEFWVGVSFVLVVIVIYKPLAKAISNLITSRIQRIKNEFVEAENLKLDAQKVYADYERKFLNIKEEIDDIISEENLIIEENKKRRIKELDSFLKNKQNEVDAKIEIAFDKASSELNSLIMNKTMDIINAIIKNKLTEKEHHKLINKSIANIGKIEFK
ncbi:MAG: hypothetical protein IKW39_03525 [Alphaproteobacteria bacterium]|nr:hypothetical protein [Alphaproteobacteria bacterium]